MWGQMGQLEWSWPGGTIRIAGPGESGEFERMVRLVNTPFENIGPDIERATVGALVRNAYQASDHAHLREALVQASTGRLKPDIFLSGVSLPLVAISDSDHIVGALQAIAPGQMITDLLKRGRRREIALSLAIRAVKVASLWVDDPPSGRRGPCLRAGRSARSRTLSRFHRWPGDRRAATTVAGHSARLLSNRYGSTEGTASFRHCGRVR